jgi:DNA-binding NarL/FixJ family response regulator
MDAQTEFLLVVEGLYSSVMEESKWLEAMRGLIRHVGGNAAYRMVSDPRTAQVIETEPFDVDPEFNRLFEAHYTAKDVRIPAALDQNVGTPLLDYQLLDLSQLRRSEIYNDLLVPFDMPYLMGLWMRKSPTQFVSFSIESSLKHGPFHGESVERLRRVIPHLLRVSQARDLLARARLYQHHFRQMLDTLPFGLIMLDERGHVIEVSRLAEEVLSDGATLHYRQRVLHALNATDDGKLQQAIGAVSRKGIRGAGGSTLTLRRITHALPLTVIVLPAIIPELLATYPRPTAMLLLLDPERKVQSTIEIMQRALMLSHAESTLALALFNGFSLREAAARLGRSYNTCKTQMKSIYAKTGCASHIDLAKKIMQVSFVSDVARKI